MKYLILLLSLNIDATDCIDLHQFYVDHREIENCYNINLSISLYKIMINKGCAVDALDTDFFKYLEEVNKECVCEMKFLNRDTATLLVIIFLTFVNVYLATITCK